MKKIIEVTLLLLMIFFTFSCSSYKKYTVIYTDYFDTVTTVTGYARSQKEFGLYEDIIEATLSELHKLFDIYNDYDGINNIKTINDNAGICPVEVDEKIINLLVLSTENANGAFNIAFGSVLKIWHSYREEALADEQNAKIPSSGELFDASLHCETGNILIDKENNTVYLNDRGMSIDAGGAAKGFAAQIAAETVRQSGAESIIINMGGNVVAVGKPLGGKKETWGIGIQNPFPAGEETIDVVRVADKAVVTSGNYQRFYTVNGVDYHHIIDPETLMPASRYNSVTVICADSAIADILSTSLFILPEEDGRKMAALYDADALWIYPDGVMSATNGYERISDYFTEIR